MNIIYVASKNDHKVSEFQRLLGPLKMEIRPLPSDVPEAPEDGLTFLENARQKAVFYSRHVGGLVLADDSGLTIPALNGEPGVYSARYAGVHGDDERNNKKLLERMSGLTGSLRAGDFVCALVLYCHSNGFELTSEGRLSGIIAEEPCGSNGFGYDPLFYLPEFRKTVAELSMAEKNQVSHRSNAVKQLIRLWEARSDADLRSR